jgi:hypothetical protein
MFPSEVFPSDRDFTAFCDCDANWGPLLFLRPAREERITLVRTAAGALLLGLPLGLFASTVLLLASRLFERAAPPMLSFPLALTFGYWVIAHLTLARAWNRRAARLASI